MNKHIAEYIKVVRSGKYAVCEEQRLLCDFVEKCFANEDIYVDEIQLEKYLEFQKYFPFKLFAWEVFCFALHNCTYHRNGDLRFPEMFIYVGRGSGKNGYLGFEDFCLLTPVNGIRKYNIDIFATSEKQAKISWQDVYEVLETHSVKMKGHFKWTKEKIINIKTLSEFTYNTSSYKTKDGFRPGKVDHDEFHGYEDGRLIGVSVTGLGKVPKPRRTIISSDGNIRGGPLDLLKEKSLEILNSGIPDNGFLPFLCHLDKEKEIDIPEAWYKANPSLCYMPELFREMQREYNDFKADPITNSDFATKRLNYPLGNKESEVTKWENLERASRPLIDLRKRACVAGFDYARTNDFISAGLLFKVDGVYYWHTHTFVCNNSADLPRIKVPLEAWAAQGLLTFVNAEEIPPELSVLWAVNEAKKLGSNILRAGIDGYRHAWLRRALIENGFSADKKTDYKKVVLVRPIMEMQNIPNISSAFTNGSVVFGDNPLMRWAVNNSTINMSSKGNMTYDKIEPKSRKTDPFKAFVQAFVVSDILDKRGGTGGISGMSQVYEY